MAAVAKETNIAAEAKKLLEEFDQWCKAIASADEQALQEAAKELSVKDSQLDRDIDANRRRIASSLVTKMKHIKRETLPGLVIKVEPDGRSNSNCILFR